MNPYFVARQLYAMGHEVSAEEAYEQLRRRLRVLAAGRACLGGSELDLSFGVSASSAAHSDLLVDLETLITWQEVLSRAISMSACSGAAILALILTLALIWLLLIAPLILFRPPVGPSSNMEEARKLAQTAQTAMTKSISSPMSHEIRTPERGVGFAD